MTNKTTDEAYTKLWVNNFNECDALQYDAKWYSRFEKNIKHRQQVSCVAKYLNHDDIWCDCPIGSGRLMRELRTKKMIGFDRSPQFAALNRKHGIDVVEGDIHELPFVNEFSLVTCLNMLFAFDKPEQILLKLINSLKRDGVLIVDLVNKNHIDATVNVPMTFATGKTFTKQEIVEYFEEHNCEIQEISRHDFWDNRKIIGWWASRRFRSVYLYKVFNWLYFKLHLFPIMNAIENIFSERNFVKYLVVVRKRQ